MLDNNLSSSKKRLPAYLRNILMASFAVDAFVFDLLSKFVANANLVPHQRHLCLPGFLNLNLVTNTGLAFGFANKNELLAKCLATCVFILLLYFYCRRYLLPSSENVLDIAATSKAESVKPAHSFLEQSGMSIILGAAAGNLCERFVYGRVTDFLEFAFISFPVFNLADVLIDVGVGLVLIAAFRENSGGAKGAV